MQKNAVQTNCGWQSQSPYFQIIGTFKNTLLFLAFAFAPMQFGQGSSDSSYSRVVNFPVKSSGNGKSLNSFNIDMNGNDLSNGASYSQEVNKGQIPRPPNYYPSLKNLRGSDTLSVFPPNFNTNRRQDSNFSSEGPMPAASTEAATTMPSSSDSETEGSTVAPVKGAIDYVLLPLIILGISGPIFVVMYIVMASMEYKLPPNVQQRMMLNGPNMKTYFDIDSVYSKAIPVMGMVFRSVNEVLEQEECREMGACKLGAFLAHKAPRFAFYEGLEKTFSWVTPKKYLGAVKEYFYSGRKNQGDEICLKFKCTPTMI